MRAIVSRRSLKLGRLCRRSVSATSIKHSNCLLLNVYVNLFGFIVTSIINVKIKTPTLKKGKRVRATVLYVIVLLSGSLHLLSFVFNLVNRTEKALVYDGTPVWCLVCASVGFNH